MNEVFDRVSETSSARVTNPGVSIRLSGCPYRKRQHPYPLVERPLLREFLGLRARRVFAQTQYYLDISRFTSVESQHGGQRNSPSDPRHPFCEDQ